MSAPSNAIAPTGTSSSSATRATAVGVIGVRVGERDPAAHARLDLGDDRRDVVFEQRPGVDHVTRIAPTTHVFVRSA